MTSPTAGKVTSFAVEYIVNPNETYAPAVEDVTNIDDNHILPDGCNDLGGTTKTFKTIEITDAETLCGKSCDFYLWRPNHRGTQPISSVDGLQNILNSLTNGVQNSIIYGDNVPGPGIGVFSEKAGQTLYFKRINASDGIIISELDGVITLSATGGLQDPSIRELFDFYYDLEANVDSSLDIIRATYIPDVSLSSTDFQWLNGILYTTTGGGGVTYLYVDGSLLARDASITNLWNWNLRQDASINQLFNSIDWKDTYPVSANIGGVNSGDRFDGSTAIDVLEKMLYEYFPPYIHTEINPSNVYPLFRNSTYYGEKNGTSYDVSIGGFFNNSTFSKLLISDASILIDGVGSLSYSKISYPNVSDGFFGWEITGPPLLENRIYTIQIYDNFMTNPTEVSLGINYVYPYLYGVVDDISSGGLNNTILGSFYSSGQKLVVPEQTNEINFVRPSGIIKAKFVYAYDASYGDLSSIFDVKNDFNVTSSFDLVTINNVLIGTELKTYKAYIKSHWIDVSSFKLIFNI